MDGASAGAWIYIAVAAAWSVLPFFICFFLAASKGRSGMGWALLAIPLGWFAVLGVAIATDESTPAPAAPPPVTAPPETTFASIGDRPRSALWVPVIALLVVGGVAVAAVLVGKQHARKEAQAQLERGVGLIGARLSAETPQPNTHTVTSKTCKLFAEPSFDGAVLRRMLRGDRFPSFYVDGGGWRAVARGPAADAYLSPKCKTKEIAR